MTTRQTLRDFLTSIGSSSTSISIPVDPGSNGIVDVGDDLGKEPNTGKELLDQDTKESLMGDYLSFVTRKNEYPIAPGIHESVSPVRGSALSPAETSSAFEVFADSRVKNNAESLNRSNSMRFDAAGSPISTIVDKLGDGSATSGNDLLSDTVSAERDADIAPSQTNAVKGAFATFKKYNYYSPTSSPSNYARDDEGNRITPTEFESSRQTRFQIGKGDYSLEATEISAEITQDDLANIARSMILKSAGWDESIKPGDAKDPNTAFSSISADSLGRFPEIVRDNLGIVDAFRAQDSYGFPANPDGSSFLEDRGTVLVKDYSEAIYTKTRGGTHTPDQPFGESPNSNNRIQSLQAGLSMIGLAALLDKKMINISQIIKDLQLTEDSVLKGPYYLGRSTKSDLQSKTRALVRSFMPETGIYSYEKCVSEGLYSCFGYNTEQDRVDTQNEFTNVASLASRYGELVKKIANDLNQNFYDSPLGLSHGFWRAVSESVLRTISDIKASTQANDGADYIRCLLQMKDSLAVRVMKVFATIGYQRLTIQSITTAELESGSQPQNPYGVDDYPNAPGTRQMKSRDGALLNRSSLAWRNSALPSAFILPIEAMIAALDADYMFDVNRGSNPIRGMLGSTLYDKTYVKSTKNAGPIPSNVAKMLEDRLGAEYVPFYFRDLRTNEIIAFHAFLDSLSDSFSTGYSETRGFGRSEPVYNYSNTTRSINLSFTLVATSKEDFDEMWFKINKLVTLSYPQYTRGRKVQSFDTSTLIGTALKTSYTSFEQPFSQLVGGTPVVRIRLGDILKTNYSRSNFGRLFGVGNDTFYETNTDDTRNEDASDTLRSVLGTAKTIRNLGSTKPIFDLALLPFLAYAGSPMELSQFTSLTSNIQGPWAGVARMGSDVLLQAISGFLVNGFVNPFLYENRTILLNKPRGDFSDTRTAVNAVTELLGIKLKGILKPRATPYLVKVGSQQKYLRLLRPIFVSLTGTKEGRTGQEYEVRINDSTVTDDLKDATFTVSTADLYVDTGRIVDVTAFPGVLLSTGVLSSFAGTVANAGNAAASEGIRALGNIPVDIPFGSAVGSMGRTFIAPENNPITRAFEDRMGEGMAGVIKNMSFSWIDIPWELDWNSRAPRACKITVIFSPIHDIAPGIDSNGFNRAPVYNIGQIMHDTFGNSRADGGAGSQFYYKQGGAIAESAIQPTTVTNLLKPK